MKIGHLKSGMSNISVEGKVIDKTERKSVQTRYGMRDVANIVLQDETGEIKVSLWEGQIDQVKVGDKVRITGAFVSEFKSELQLNIPKKGRIEVI